MKTIRRADENQPDIVRKLRRYPGVSVQPIHTVGRGCPDILVGHKRRNFLFEIKDPDRSPSGRRLTLKEQKFHLRWCGQVHTVTNTEEILVVIGYGISEKKPQRG